MHPPMPKWRSLIVYGSAFLLLVLVCSVSLLFSPVKHAHADGNDFTSVSVTIYVDQGTMADGNQTYNGACAAFTDQFTFGTQIQLFYPSDHSNPQFSCTIEDTGTQICYNDIDVALPGELDFAINFGRQNMDLQVVGFDQGVADQAAANHPAGPGCSG